MKKSLFLIFLATVAIGTLNGCSKSSNVGSDKMLGFLMQTEELYCTQVGLIREYNQASSTDRYKSMMVNGSDVPSQRALAAQILNKMTINNLAEHLDTLKANPLSKEFPETIRLLGLAYDFFYKFLENDKSLSSYQEFQNISVDFGSAAQTLTTIEGNLKQEYSYTHEDMSKAPIGEANLLNIDNICTMSLSVNSN